MLGFKSEKDRILKTPKKEDSMRKQKTHLKRFMIPRTANCGGRCEECES